MGAWAPGRPTGLDASSWWQLVAAMRSTTVSSAALCGPVLPCPALPASSPRSVPLYGLKVVVQASRTRLHGCTVRPAATPTLQYLLSCTRNFSHMTPLRSIPV